MEKERKIKLLLGRNLQGLTITDVVRKSKYSRSTVRNVLAKLEGANQVLFKKVGMAKLYFLGGKK